MSANAQIIAQVREEIAAALAGHGGGEGADPKDVTQLKRENTGLRNRVKELEDRVTALENTGRPVTAHAQTAEVKSRASGK